MKFNKKIVRIFFVLVIVFIIFCFGVYHLFFSMNNLPYGEFVDKSTSPQGTYTVRLYETNPALSVGGTRGEVTNNKTKKKRNIYWEYNRYLYEDGIEGNKILWESDEIVIINGIKLNVKKDTYDFRRN